MSNNDFKVINSYTNQTAIDLNYDILPEYERHIALQIGDLKLSLTGDLNGWLVCNGRSLSISDYPELYTVIGNNFGSVGTGYFNIPDFTSKVIGMFGPSAQESPLTIRTMGETVGSETHTLSINEMPSHYHTGHTNLAGSHTHTHNANGGAGTSVNPAVGLAISNSFNTAITTDTSNGELNLWTTPIALNINSVGDHSHTFTTDATGGSEPFDNMQPTLFGCKVLIFAKWIRKTSMTQIQYKY